MPTASAQADPFEGLTPTELDELAVILRERAVLRRPLLTPGTAFQAYSL
jgi:hypothetical protein